MSKYSTRATWLGNAYGCRVFFEERLVVEGRCKERGMIGGTFRDLFRTLDKCGGDEYTSAVRKRKYRLGNPVASVVHWWGGKKKDETVG